MADIIMRKLSPQDDKPLYAQIMTILEDEIISGRLKPGDQLPTQEALATHFSVSLAPVKQALRELEERGIISTLQGRGTYVLDATPLSEEIIDANRIPHFTRDMAEKARTPKSIVLSCQRVSAKNEPLATAQLKLDQGEDMVRIERIRFADDEPLSLQTGYIPHKLVPGLAERGLKPDESLTVVLEEQYGLIVAISRQHITATAATETDVKYLKCNLGAPLLLVERTSFLSSNEPVEFVTDRRIPEFSFVVWLRRQQARIQP